jgi:hypothetical protein
VRTVRLILLSTLAASVYAQDPRFAQPLDIWRSVRAALLDKGDEYFNQLKGSEIPPEGRMFEGTVVSKPSANKLIVDVDNAAGDAILIFHDAPEGVDLGSRIHFKGVVDSWTRQPYSLTLQDAEFANERATAPARIGGAVARTYPARPPDAFFSHPEELCGALEDQGIHTSQWAPVGKGPHPPNTPFDCDNYTNPEDRDKTPLADRGIGIIFRVSGDWQWRADIISVAATVDKPFDFDAAQTEFIRLVAAVFKFIGKPEPAGLIRAIHQRRYYQVRRRYGVIWFNFRRSYGAFPAAYFLVPDFRVTVLR